MFNSIHNVEMPLKCLTFCLFPLLARIAECLEIIVLARITECLETKIFSGHVDFIVSQIGCFALAMKKKC